MFIVRPLLFATALLSAFSLNAQQSTRSDIKIVLYDSGSAFINETHKVSPDPAGLFQLSELPPTLSEDSFFATASFPVASLSFIPSAGFWLDNLIGKEILLLSEDQSVNGNLKRINGSSLFLWNGEKMIFIPDYMQYRVVYDGEAPVFLKGFKVAVAPERPVKGEQELKIQYQIAGLSWSAQYEATLSDQNDSALFSAWAEIENETGHDFGKAFIRLIAGQPKRSQQAPRPRARFLKQSMAMEAAEEFSSDEQISSETAVSEYYSFDIKENVALSEHRIRKIPLFAPVRIKVSKSYIIDAYPGKNELIPAKVEIGLVNDKPNGLGRVLPAGTIRFYEGEASYKTLLGESALKNLPDGDRQQLSIGFAFDVQAAHFLTDSKQNGPKIREESAEYRLVNRKKEPVSLSIRKYLGSNAQILKSDVTWEKNTSEVATALVPLKAGEEKRIKLVIRYTYE